MSNETRRYMDLTIGDEYDGHDLPFSTLRVEPAVVMIDGVPTSEHSLDLMIRILKLARALAHE